MGERWKGYEEIDPVALPVHEEREIRSMFLSMAWAAAEMPGVGRVDITHAVGALVVEVRVEMEDGRRRAFRLDLEEAVQVLVRREVPALYAIPGAEEGLGDA